MSRINKCESCLEGPIRETEFYDDLGVWKGQFPLLCWRCGGGAKLEQSRIIKLLEDEVFTKAFGRSKDFNAKRASLIALIKEDNK